MAVLVTKHLITLAFAASISVAPVETFARETPAQTASPAIAETLSSLERAAGVTDPGYSSPAVVTDTKSLDPAAATKAWLATVPRDQRERSDAYFEGGYWLLLWNFLLVAAISAFLLESRISARLRDFAERAARFRSLQVACYAIPYFLIVATLSFPLNLYEHFFREHQYGFATQTFLPWFREQLIGFGLTIIGGTILLIALYTVFRRAPRTWWIWGTGLVVIFLFIVVFIAPLCI